MKAPVYRNIEAKNTLLGLAFPTEVVLFLVGCMLAIQFLSPWMAAVAMVASYACIRLISMGRPPHFAQHWLAWQVRRLYAGGRLSAVARSRTPRFPHALSEARDVPRRRATHG